MSRFGNDREYPDVALKDLLPTPANVCSLGTTRRVADVPLRPRLTQCGLSQRLLSGSVIPRGPVRTNRISTRYYVWKWHLGPPARVRAISTGRSRPRGEGRKETELPPRAKLTISSYLILSNNCSRFN